MQPCDVCKTIEASLEQLGEKSKNSEIAFFGGSFTAIDREYMLALLEATKPYIDRFSGIRISTRPDYIDDEILSLLKSYKVSTIELGAQSMDDEVLKSNNRGHKSSDVIKSSLMIKKYGFKLGLQMMTGLYNADFKSDVKTAKTFIDLKPNCVRIYPTVVMKDTQLAQLYTENKYKTYTLDESISLCAKLILMFQQNDINVIRLGLHYSESLVENSLSDSYHPAFKELCESKIFMDKILLFLKNVNTKNIVLKVNSKSYSKLVGQKKSNIKKLEKLGYKTEIIREDNLGKYDVIVEEQG